MFNFVLPSELKHACQLFPIVGYYCHLFNLFVLFYCVYACNVLLCMYAYVVIATTFGE